MVRIRAAAPHGARAIICLEYKGDADGAAVDRLRRTLIDSPAMLHCIDCSGSFDFMAEFGCDTLDDYQSLVDRIRRAGSDIIEALEHVLVCRRYLKGEEEDECLWVPAEDGRRRVPFALIDTVEAEGDYVRISIAGRRTLVHTTLRALERRMLPAGFLKLHRSLLVRQSLVEALLHDDHGWHCRLRDGSRHHLPRARVHAVRRQLGVESSMENDSSPTLAVVERATG